MLSKRLVHEKEEEHAQETLIREMTLLPLFFKWPPSHDAYLVGNYEIVKMGGNLKRELINIVRILLWQIFRERDG